MTNCYYASVKYSFCPCGVVFEKACKNNACQEIFYDV